MWLTGSLEDIPAKHVPTLAALLQWYPNEDYADQKQRIQAGVKALPFTLRGPGRIMRFLIPPRIDSCDWHKSVNRCVTDVILHHIQIEVGVRLNNLVAHSEMMSQDQLDRVSRLRDLHALWLPPAVFEKTFMVSAHQLPWKYNTKQCDACILSAIGGSMQTLWDLRCVMRSRATSSRVAKHGNPRLQIWVEAWIEALVGYIHNTTDIPVDSEQQTIKNEQQAVALKRLRAKIYRRDKRVKKIRPGRGLKDAKSEKTDKAFSEASTLEDKGEEVVPTKSARLKEVDNGELDEDATDVELAGVDAYSALMSSGHNSTAIKPLEYRPPACFAESSTDVVTEMRRLTRSIAEAPYRVQEDDYVPARQNWKKEPESSKPDNGRRPRRRESWETVVFDSNYIESGITSRLPMAGVRLHQPRPASSIYPSEIPEAVSHRQSLAISESDSLKEYLVQQPRGKPSQGKTEISARLQDRKSARPDSETLPNTELFRKPSSKSAEGSKGRKSARPDSATLPSSELFRKPASTSAEGFKRAYDTLAQDLDHACLQDNVCTADPDISMKSRMAMTPECLHFPGRHGEGSFPAGEERQGHRSSKSRDKSKDTAKEPTQDTGRDHSTRNTSRPQDKGKAREEDAPRTHRMKKDEQPSAPSRKYRDDHRQEIAAGGKANERALYKPAGGLSHVINVATNLAMDMERETQHKARTQDKAAHKRHRDSHSPEKKDRRNDADAAAGDTTAGPSGTPRRERDGEKSTRTRDSRREPSKQASNETTWSAAYEDGLKQRSDLQWFYDAKKKRGEK